MKLREDKMEITNNMLAVLVIVAMAISLTGTATLLSQVPGPFSLTGFGTTQTAGQANVTLEQEASIQLTTASVDFGDLGLQESNATSGLEGGASQIGPLVLRNIGTIEVNVSLCFYNGTGDVATVYSLWEKQQAASYYFQYNATKSNTTTAAVWYGGEDEADKLSNVPINGTTGWCSTNPANLIYNLSETPTQEYIDVQLNITAPDGEPAGAKGTILRFTASIG
jgi:hypothetical protein